MPKQNFIFYCLFLTLIHPGFSRAEEPAGRAEDLRAKLPEKIEGKKRLELSTFLEAPTHSFLISTDAGRVDTKVVGQRVQYNPTFGPNVGVRAAYDLWSLSYSRRLSFVEGAEQAKYGKTDYDDWRLGFNVTENLLLETYYQNYHGFYTDLNGHEGLQTTVSRNSSAAMLADPVLASESIIVSRPDINALNYGLRATYVLPLMGIARVFASEEERRSMNWEFNLLAKAYYNRLAITGDRPLVPDANQGAFSPIASLREYWAHTAGVGLGLGVAVPASSRTTIGFSGLAGEGMQRQTAIFAGRDSTAFASAQELNADFYIHWKGENNGFRMNFYLDTFSSKVNDINFDSSSLGINMAYTYSGILL